MALIENLVVINRPATDVFDYLSDQRSELEWNPNVRIMEKLTDGPVGVGTKFKAKWTKSPVLTTEIVRYDRPSGWTYVNAGSISVRLDADLEENDGRTTLRTRFDATPHGLMKLIFPIFLMSMRKEEARNMELIKKALESKTERS